LGCFKQSLSSSADVDGQSVRINNGLKAQIALLVVDVFVMKIVVVNKLARLSNVSENDTSVVWISEPVMQGLKLTR